MDDQIYGHEVLRMMVGSGKAYTRESLREAIVAQFGAAARFCTCSAEGMTADQLIDFLDSRGKFVGRGTGFSTAADKICEH